MDAVGFPLVEAAQYERHEQQPRVELRRGAEPEERPRPDVAAVQEGERAGGGERDREQVPVHEAVDEERRRQREPEGPGAHHQVQAKDDDERRDGQQERVREEEARGGARVEGTGHGVRHPVARRIRYIERTGYSSHWPEFGAQVSR